MHTEEPFVTAAEQEIRQARFDGKHAQRMGCVDNQYCPDPVTVPCQACSWMRRRPAMPADLSTANRWVTAVWATRLGSLACGSEVHNLLEPSEVGPGAQGRWMCGLLVFTR